MMILTSLKYMTKLHKQIIKICIKQMVSHKLKIEGKTRKERFKIRNDLFEIINLKSIQLDLLFADLTNLH